MQHWHDNSRCVLAVSSNGAGGPYKRHSVVIDPWCHGASLARDPVSGRWIFGYELRFASTSSACATAKYLATFQRKGCLLFALLQRVFMMVHFSVAAFPRYPRTWLAVIVLI